MNLEQLKEKYRKDTIAGDEFFELAKEKSEGDGREAALLLCSALAMACIREGRHFNTAMRMAKILNASFYLTITAFFMQDKS